MAGLSQRQAVATSVERSLDLRFSFSATPQPTPGYHPAGDASSLMATRSRSPAQVPIPGTLGLGSYAPDQRYVIKMPSRWNGTLVVVGTPAFRSEFASDAIWGDYLLARGCAYAASNKGIPYNAIVDPEPATGFAYPIAFDPAGMSLKGQSMRVGVLSPKKVPIASWNDDFVALTKFASKFCAEHAGAAPTRTYAVGYANGGAQVRSIIERRPELVDGGIDWSGLYWSTERNVLTSLPAFLAAMPAYVASNFKDPAVAAALARAGFPADVTQPDADHPSLWFEFYANQPAFYADLSVFANALLVDPAATPQALATPQARAAYAPSKAAQFTIASFAHTGKIGKPLISLGGAADPFTAPEHHLTPYLEAVRAAGASARHWQYVVAGGTHVDAFTAFGFRLRPMLPFAWAAFEQLVSIVERGYTPPGAGTQQVVDNPSTISLR